MGLFDDISAIEEFLGELKTVKGSLKHREELSPLETILPVAYKRILVRQEKKQIMNPAAYMAFLGYIHSQYPELRSYFITDKQRAGVDHTFNTLMDDETYRNDGSAQGG